MTFKKSSALKAHFKIRFWVVALHVIAALLYDGLVPALYLGGFRMQQIALGYSSKKLTEVMQQASISWFSVSLFLAVGMVLFLAVITGTEAFSYLFKRSSVDFYDSLPISFGHRFILHMGAGILLFAGVFALGAGAEIVIVAIFSIGFKGIAMASMIGYI